MTAVVPARSPGTRGRQWRSGRLRGKAGAQVDGAVGKALRETVFRFELVMRINVIAHELIERETLIYVVIRTFMVSACTTPAERPSTFVRSSRSARLT